MKAKGIPKHLQRYLIKQDYRRYTPEDHAVWRFIMRELTFFLNQHAHPSYKSGVKKTGITLNKIPSIQFIDKCLRKHGWRAGCVSGFIPPAAFMELQAHGILPIATEMRRVENLDYTPAPDIVHEAAGHAPLLADKEYSRYLRRYAEIASKAIITKKDLEQYEAIRELSDLKEQPHARKDAIEKAYQRLINANTAITEPTEAVLLSRMAWWTTEYGLIGENKIFGAGLLSSVAESQNCLKPHVEKIPFSIECTKYPYDITDPQPQLFVAESFKHLEEGLKELENQLSYKRGGLFGLKRMKDAGTVNSIQLSSGIQISGVLTKYFEFDEKPIYVQLTGPTQLSYKNKEIKGQGKKYHSQGYGAAVGRIRNFEKCISQCSERELKQKGLSIGTNVSLVYESGVRIQGKLKKITKCQDRIVLLSFEKCHVQWANENLFLPEWGTYDLAIGWDVVSVFGGPADRKAYGSADHFVAKKLPPKKFTTQEKKLFKLYGQVNKWIETGNYTQSQLQNLLQKAEEFPDAWLLRFEILQLSTKKKWKTDWDSETRKHVLETVKKYPDVAPYVRL